MSRPETCRIAAMPADYQRYGIAKGAKRVLARIAGFDGAYMRFTGQVTVERIGSDPVPETVTAPALWELMYFGKTTA